MDKKIIGYEFKGIKFFFEGGKLVSDFGVSQINNTDIRILRTMIESEDKIISKDSPPKNLGKPEIEQSISRMRRTFWDMRPSYSLFIENVPHGYRFIAEAEPILDEPDPIVPPVEERLNIFRKWLLSNKFNSWLFDYKNKLMWVALVLIAATFVVSFLLSFSGNEYSGMIVSGMQAGIILLAIIYPIYEPEEVDSKIEDERNFENLGTKVKKATGCATFLEWKDTNKIAEKVLEQYRIWWKVVLISWLLLYICFAISGYPHYRLDHLDPNQTGNTVSDPGTIFIIVALSVVSTFLNNFSSLTIFIFFSILNSPTKFGRNDKPRIHQVLSIGIPLVVIFTGIELASYYFQPAGARFNTLKLFDGFSGIAAGTVMALYFGRLQSKFLNPPSWLIILLFIYTAIQSLFLMIDMNTWGIVLKNAALAFKSLLFLYMTFLFQSERLSFYLVRVRKTYENIEKEYDNFSLIRR